MRNSEWSLPAYDEVVEENLMCRLEEGRCLPVDAFLFEEFDKIPEEDINQEKIVKRKR